MISNWNIRKMLYKLHKWLQIEIESKTKKYEFDSWFKIEIQERENSKYYKSLLFEMVLWYSIKEIIPQLISIPRWDNKSFTISVRPFLEANIKGVSNVIWYQFQ